MPSVTLETIEELKKGHEAMRIEDVEQKSEEA